MGAVCKGAVAALGALLALLAPSASAQIPGLPPLPIPEGPMGGSQFEGRTAVPNPIEGVPEPPRHPFMAPNGRSNLHNDAYQTDAYRVSGPLGDGAEISNFFARECGSILFDAQGRIISVCVGLDRPVLTLMDPQTLAVLATLPLPLRNFAGGANPFQDFTGGGYFYLDHRDRSVVPTNEKHILEIALTPGPAFSVTRDYDASAGIASNDGIISVLPDWSGRLWFATRRGVVGAIDRDSGQVRRMRLEGEGISNSFAVDETGGVYIVSDTALYRFDAGPNGGPVVTWRRPYPDVGVRKPGQSDAGSGTTPTLIGSKFVAITDNDDPMNIRVYRRQPSLKPPKAKRRRALRRAKTPAAKLRLKVRWRTRKRDVCHEPVFPKGSGATDQSLIAAGNAIIAENNYGYSGVTATQFGRTTAPGLTRVDLVAVRSKGKQKGRKGKGPRRRGKGKVKRFECRTVWESAERAPSVVPKVSLGNGLVYTYTKPAGSGEEDPWFFTALDFRTGETVYRRLAGEGLGHNNNYAPVTLGPDGTAYVGVLGGLVSLKK